MALNPALHQAGNTGVVYKALTSPLAVGTKEVVTFVISGTPTAGFFLIGMTGSGLTRRADLETLIDGTASVAQNYLAAILAMFPGVHSVTVVRSGSTPNYTFTCTVNRYKNIGNWNKNSNQLTGGTGDVTVSVTTAGVDADGLGYPAGTVFVTTTGEMWLNTGTADLPALKQIGINSYPVAKTADYTVLANESNKTFMNTGAAGTVVFGLPPAVRGLRYKFVITAAQHLRIDPNGSETINKADGTVGGAGKYLGINTVNSFVEIECFVDGHWTFVHGVGAWALEA